MVPAVGRPFKGTIIYYGTMGTPLYQNPFTKTDMWYGYDNKGAPFTTTINAVGSGTLWTTGQVGAFAKTGAYYTSHWRTGFDSRTASGRGVIQLESPAEYSDTFFRRGAV